MPIKLGTCVVANTHISGDTHALDTGIATDNDVDVMFLGKEN